MTIRARCFRRNASGAAAVEFAVLAPLLLFLFLAMVEISAAHNRRKVLEASVATIADLVAQQRQLNGADAAGLNQGFEQMLESLSPGGASSVAHYVASVSRTDSGAEVDWSFDENGNRAFSPGSRYDDLKPELDLAGANSPVDVGASVIVVKIEYTGEPGFTFQRFLRGAAAGGAGAPVVERYAIRWPRLSARVLYEP